MAKRVILGPVDAGYRRGYAEGMPVKTFRFGVAVASASSRGGWIDTAKKAEDLGYSVLNVADHFRETLGMVAALMAAADATETIRVGPFVAANDFRHPVVLAKEAATIDLLSDGRLEMGMGAGWLLGDYSATGIPFDPPGERVDRLEESVAIVKRFLLGERFSFDGKHYRIQDLEPSPASVQDPPPLLLGGGGRRLLALAAREADIVSVMPQAKRGGGLEGSDALERPYLRKLAWLKEKAAERWDLLELNVLNQRVEVTTDRPGAAERIVREWAEEDVEATVEDVFAMPLALIGTVEEIVDTLRYRRETQGVSYITVFDRYMDAFAPVVDELADT